MRPDIYALVGKFGIIQHDVSKLFSPALLPKLYWFTDWASVHFGWTEEEGLSCLLWFYAGVLTLFTIGFGTRLMAIAAWILHLAFKASGASSAYGVTEFINILLFYCMFMPVARCWSVDALLRRRKPTTRSLGAALSRRVLRWHLCIVYVSSGIEKSKGEQWRSGEAIWRATFRQENPLTMPWLADLPWLAMMLCWGTLVLEAGYLAGMWYKKTRPWFLAGIISLHASIAICLGLWAFASVMILFNLAAWAGPDARLVVPNWARRLRPYGRFKTSPTSFEANVV